MDIIPVGSVETLGDRRRSGWLAEAMAITAFIDDGYEVSRPLMDNLPYDLIVVKDNAVSRVQVKSLVSKRSGSLYLPLTHGSGSKNRSLYTHSVELFVGVDLRTGAMWLIKHDGVSGVGGKTSVSVHGLPAWRNQPPAPVAITLQPRKAWQHTAVGPLGSHTTPSKTREKLSKVMPTSKPESLSDDDWDVITRFMRGYGAKTFASEFKVSRNTARRRIDSIAKRIVGAVRDVPFAVAVA